MAESFPLHAVTDWKGNSQLVATICHLQATDGHFAKAAQIPAHNTTEITEIDRATIKRPLRENEKAPEFPGLSVARRDMHNLPEPRRGAELSQESPGKSRSDWQGDSLSDSLADVRLARLIEVWPALSDDVKAEILTRAGVRPDDVDDFNDVTGNSHGNGVL